MAVELKQVGDIIAVTMSGLIEKKLKANTFLWDIAYGGARWKYAESGYFQYDVKGGSVQMAGITDENGHAVQLDRRNADTTSGYVPMMSVELPLAMSPEMFKRRPGQLQEALSREGKNGTAFRNFLAQMEEDMADLIDAHVARKEWLAAMAVSGKIDYADAQGNNFTYDFNKPGGNTFNAIASWDGTSAVPMTDVQKVYNKSADVDGFVSVALVNSATADKITQNVEKGNIKPDQDKVLDVGRVSPFASRIAGRETDYRTRRLPFTINGAEIWVYGGKDPVTSAAYIPDNVLRFLDLSSENREVMWAPILHNINYRGTKLPDYVKTKSLAYTRSVDEPPSIKQIVKQRYIPVEKRADKSFDLTIFF